MVNKDEYRRMWDDSSDIRFVVAQGMLLW